MLLASCVPVVAQAAQVYGVYGLLPAQDVSIPDNDGVASMYIDTTGAPAGSFVTAVKVRAVVQHADIGDLQVWLAADQNGTEQQYLLHDRTGAGGTVVDVTVDGLHEWDTAPANQRWYLKAQDFTVGNTGYIDYFEIWVQYDLDATPPTVPGMPDLLAADDTGEFDTDNITAATPLRFSWAPSTDAGSGVRGYWWALDDPSPETGGLWTFGPNCTVFGPAEGGHTLYVAAEDRAGNVSAASSLAFVCDRTPPVAPMATDPAGAISTLTPVVAWAGNGSWKYRALVQKRVTPVSWNNLWESAETIATSAPVPAGILIWGETYRSLISAWDGAGNWSNYGSPATEFSPTDTTPPTTPGQPDLAAEDDTGKSDTDDLTKKTAGLTFSWAASTDTESGVAEYEWNLDMGAWASIGNVTAADIGAAHGSHVFYLRARDGVGNLSAESSLAFTVDTEAPASPVATAPAGDVMTLTPTIMWPPDGSWKYTARVQVQGVLPDVWHTVWESGETTLSEVAVPAGILTWELRYRSLISAWDDAGNESGYNGAGTAFRPHALPPPSSPGTPDLSDEDDTGKSSTDNLTRKTFALTFSWAPSIDASGTGIAGYEYLLDAGAWKWIGANTQVDIAAGHGWHILQVRAKDNTDAYSASSSLPFLVDTEAPAWPVATAPTGVIDLLTPTVVWPDEGSWKYQVRINRHAGPDALEHWVQAWESGEVIGHSIPVPAGVLEAAVRYQPVIRACDDAGNWGQYGAGPEFIIHETVTIDGVPDYSQADTDGDGTLDGDSGPVAAASLLAYYDYRPYLGMTYWNLVDNGSPATVPPGDMTPIAGYDGYDSGLVHVLRQAMGWTPCLDKDLRLDDGIEAVCNDPAYENNLAFKAELKRIIGDFENLKADIRASKPVLVRSKAISAFGDQWFVAYGFDHGAAGKMVLAHDTLAATGDVMLDWDTDIRDVIYVTPGDEPTDHYEPDDIPAEARLIEPDHIFRFRQTHNFKDATDTDWVKWDAEANKNYSIVITNLGPDASTELYIYRDMGGVPEATPYAQYTVGGGGRIDIVSTENRAFYLKVLNKNGMSGPMTQYDIEVLKAVSTSAYRIHGIIRTAGGDPILGVRMHGLQGTPATDIGGWYAGDVPEGWSGTVTPVLLGYVFTPVSRSYTNVTDHIRFKDYTAIATVHTISGIIQTAGGVPVLGVRMHGLPLTPATDSGGWYNAVVPHGWSGTVAPQLAGYTFTPETYVYNGVTGGLMYQDFTAVAGSPSAYAIAGYVRTPTGLGIDGVTMTGLPGNPVTDGNGHYRAVVEPAWNGIVVPRKPGFAFRAPARPYAGVAGHRADETYAGFGKEEDSDGDGVSDLDEMAAGTSSTDPREYLRIADVRRDQEGRVVIFWDSAPGRLYTIFESASPDGPWQSVGETDGDGSRKSFKSMTPAPVFFRVGAMEQ